MGVENSYLDKQGLGTLVTIIRDNFVSKSQLPLEKGEGLSSLVQKIDWGINEATGRESSAFGASTKAYGSFSFAEGSSTTASGLASHAEGSYTTASESSSHAEGDRTIASGNSSHAEGNYTKAYGNNSHAEGYNTTASGFYSHAEGNYTTAYSNNSHAEGNNTTASGYTSHAEGSYTTASGNSSHAEGNYTKAYSDYSHAEGSYTTASGYISHAEGYQTIASGAYSHVEGYWAESLNDSEHASGRYNISTKSSGLFGDAKNTLFSVGNGASPVQRHNAFEIKQNGDIYISDMDSGGEYYEKQMLKLPSFGYFEIEEEPFINISEAQPSLGGGASAPFYELSALPNETEIQIQLDGKYKVVIGDKTWYLTAIQKDNTIVGITDGTTTKQNNHPVPEDGTFMIYFSNGRYCIYTRFDFTNEQVIVSKMVSNDKKLNSRYLPIEQTVGNSSTSVMSQKAVYEALRDLKEELGETVGGGDTEVGINHVPYQNQIIYTTTDNAALDLSNGLVESDKYYPKKGFGIITFTDDLTDNLSANIFADKSTLKSAILPNGITKLPSACFANCSNLEKVELPDSITVFEGGSQFLNCAKLEAISLPNQLMELSSYCFSSCKSLSHICLPNNLKTIGERCFVNSGISNIDLNNVVSIGNSAFQKSQLISLDTKNVQTIGNVAFQECNDLITVYLNTALTSLGNGCFEGCKSLSNVNFTENSKLTEIPSACFANCTSLNEISIDTNINSIGGSAFISCPLRSITIHSSTITSYAGVFTQGANRPTLEYFYTKSSANLDSGLLGSTSPTIKTIVLDTPTYIENLGPIQALRNFATIYVAESLLQRYKDAYPNYEGLFKPITGTYIETKYWVGTEDEYDELEDYDPNMIYYIIEGDDEV